MFSGPRLWVTDHHVIACYGSLYEVALPEDEGLCAALLDAYLTRGPDALKHLNGRYNIAIWDRRARVLQFFGDRLGSYRHYGFQNNDALHLSCEVKTLALFQHSVEIDPAGLASMLSFGYHLGPLTLLKQIQCLPNACDLTYVAASHTLTLARYWRFPYGEQPSLTGTADELAEALHAHLTTALKRQLRGVDKLLLPLSGGLDSRTMAELLQQSGFSGEVQTYSFGQTSSRDRRYGQAIAKKLGYPHLSLPTPADFMTRHLEEDAWLFDAEWSAEMHWPVRFAYRDPVLGDRTGWHALSGMFGDIVLGSDRFGYRRTAGDTPLDAHTLRSLFYRINQEYGTQETVLGLFEAESARLAKQRLDDILEDTLKSCAHLPPFLALLRAEFEHRQQRHTSMVAQVVERERPMLTPFLDRDVVDFSLRIPYELFHGKKLYKRMIRNHLPKVASVPYADSGLPISDAPIRAALHWRMEKLMRHIPRLQKHINRRNAFFNFQQGIERQHLYFAQHTLDLSALAPTLNVERAVARYTALIEGTRSPADQACAFLPAAVFTRMLKQRLAHPVNR